jgi:beta-glucosidase
MHHTKCGARLKSAGAIIAILACFPFIIEAQVPDRTGSQAPKGPWTDKSLSPDRRAALLVEQMTLDEKLGLLHGTSMRSDAGGSAEAPAAVARSLGGAGFVPGIPRLGVPDIQMADSAVGVARGASRSRYSTALPSNLSEACSWDLKLAAEYGALVGRELRDQGFTMSLGGGVNLMMDPRNGRNFEYKGEDPILAGKIAGQEIKALQAQGVMGDIKHFALNNQETGRNIGNVIMDRRSMRESELLAFEIAIKEADISAVMCSYNKIDGDWACENNYLLNGFLKKAVGHKGFVVSDWGATHSTVKAALSGLDMEQPGSTHFGDKLKEAVEKGEVPIARLNDMVYRILRSMFAVGLLDNPVHPKVVDVFGGLEIARRVAEEGTVLLKNGSLLPLDGTTLKSIAVIGSHADAGVPSGGGSAQVDPPGGNAVPPPPPPPGTPLGPGGFAMFARGPVWFPSIPLRAIRAKAPNAKVEYNPGTDPAAAASFAKSCEVAVVFVNQPTSEGRDAANLSLPDNQDALVVAVAAANPRTIVVTETGGPITMPWLDKVGAVLSAWYPGIQGAEAIANILFGDVNPSGKLAVTYSKSESDLPYPKIFAPPPAPPGAAPAAPAALAPSGFGGPGGFRPDVRPFDISYTQGLRFGYKWFDAENKEPLFPFGFGLSYTTFAYSGLKATSGKEPKLTFQVKNTGRRAGAEIAQVYVTLPASTGEPPKRLVAWDRVELKAGETKTVTLAIDPFLLSIFSVEKDGWEFVSGEYKFWVGASSRNLPLSEVVKLPD